jgi:C1A family cysteine protease
MDCTGDGCEGGNPSNSFKYIHEAGGIETEQYYVYEAQDSSCIFDNNKEVATVDGVANIDKTDKALQQAIVQKGPVSVGIHPSRSFEAYHSGVYDVDSCEPQGVSHYVLVVGYGTENKTDYWLVKNSWVSIKRLLFR